MLTIHVGRIFSWEDCEYFAVLVTEMVYLKVFEDKRWVQNSSTIVVYIFHLAVNISLQNVIHTALSASLLANLFCWQNESTACLTPHFWEENKILQFASFHYWHNQKYRSKLHIYYPKHKVIIFPEFWKHICERVHFNKVRDLQPATSLRINTFTGIFQEFCLIWTNSYLTNTSQ